LNRILVRLYRNRHALESVHGTNQYEYVYRVVLKTRPAPNVVWAHAGEESFNIPFKSINPRARNHNNYNANLHIFSITIGMKILLILF
jgi:hypothetical protein